MIKINLNKKRKSGQEELVGFAIIIIIVSIILVVFLGSYLKKSPIQSANSYEADNFVQVILQYNTKCETTLKNLTVQDLIFSCVEGQKCNTNENSCVVLNQTLKSMIEASWPAGEGWPYKGYEFNITSKEGNVLSFSKGNITRNSKGSMQDFAKGQEQILVGFTAYY